MSIDEAVVASRGLAHFAGSTRALYGTHSSCHMAEVRACIVSSRTHPDESAFPAPASSVIPVSARTQTWAHSGTMGV